MFSAWDNSSGDRLSHAAGDDTRAAYGLTLYYVFALKDRTVALFCLVDINMSFFSAHHSPLCSNVCVTVSVIFCQPYPYISLQFHLKKRFLLNFYLPCVFNTLWNIMNVSHSVSVLHFLSMPVRWFWCDGTSPSRNWPHAIQMEEYLFGFSMRVAGLWSWLMTVEHR